MCSWWQHPSSVSRTPCGDCSVILSHSIHIHSIYILFLQYWKRIITQGCAHSNSLAWCRVFLYCIRIICAEMRAFALYRMRMRTYEHLRAWKTGKYCVRMWAWHLPQGSSARPMNLVMGSLHSRIVRLKLKLENIFICTHLPFPATYIFCHVSSFVAGVLRYKSNFCVDLVRMVCFSFVWLWYICVSLEFTLGTLILRSYRAHGELKMVLTSRYVETMRARWSYENKHAYQHSAF